MAWRRAIRDGGIIWAAQRVVLLVVGYVAVLFVSATHKQERPHPPLDPLTPHLFLHRWDIWDTHFYLDIAQYNYPHPIDAAFFPLCPHTIRLFAFVLPGHWLLAGLLASNLAALGAFIAIALLADESGIASLRSLTAYPLAFFLVVAYRLTLPALCYVGALMCKKELVGMGGTLDVPGHARSPIRCCSRFAACMGILSPRASEVHVACCARHCRAIPSRPSGDWPLLTLLLAAHS